MATSEAGFWDRWRHAMQASRPEVFEVDHQTQAGHDAEDEVMSSLQKLQQQMLKAKGVSNTCVWRGVRVNQVDIWGRKEDQKREIDAVFFNGEKLVVIEVKNWSGQIASSIPSEWVQTRRQSGERVVHRNPVLEITQKGKVLRNYLVSKGIKCCKDIEICNVVVLVNRNCIIDRSIHQMPNVLSPDDWEQMLSEQLQPVHQPEAPGWLDAAMAPITQATKGFVDMISSFVYRSEAAAGGEDASQDGGSRYSIPTTAEQSRIVEEISLLPTWDTLVLNGGKVVTGDFLDFYGQGRATMKGWYTHNTCSRMQFVHSRFSGFLQAAIGQDTTTTVMISPRASPPAAGQSASHGGGLLGSLYTHEWVTGALKTLFLVDDRVCVHVPIDTQISFHHAGQPTPTCYSVNDVESITFSTR
eukprot:GFYU01001938.1.p1 GENE.GFYU01001938.1~~GFYU01001938.1.p1  ORF type:complete len:413 (-),score=51.00 GFYU01001938.1:187-1425(-)